MSTPLNLSDLQKILIHQITGKENHDVSFLSSIGIKNAERCTVYKTAYFARISESLKEDFPKTFEVLSGFELKKRILFPTFNESTFSKTIIEEKIIECFLEHFPSNFHTIGEISQNFPNFIKQLLKESSELHKAIPFLYDLSQYEFLKIRSFLFSGAQKNTTHETLSTLSESDIQKTFLTLEDSFLLFQTIYSTELNCSPYLSIFTKNDETIEESYDFRTFQLLERLKKGCLISDFFSIPDFESIPSFSESEVASLFKDWMESGYLKWTPPLPK